MTKKQCMVCGENTCEYKIKEIPFTYKGETAFIKQPGEWCETCGEGVLTDKDTHATIKEMQMHRDRFLKIDRVEVIDEEGRAYARGGIEDVFIDFQDDGRTLKIFVSTNYRMINYEGD